MKKSDKPAQNDFTGAYDYAMKAIARSEHTRRGLERKMRKKQFFASVISDALDRLEKEGAINDERYAEIYIRKAITMKGYAPSRIRSELARRGIASELALSLTKEIDEDDELSALRRAVERRIRIYGVPETPKERARLVAYLKRLGFRPIMIRRALDMMKTK